MPKLKQLARIRSKNTGPWEICFDIMFSDADTYSKVKGAGVINAALFSRLYCTPIGKCFFTDFPNGLAMKCTIPRLIVSANVGDYDVYGSQQHFPLLEVDIPL
jgi:hypothetical protein